MSNTESTTTNLLDIPADDRAEIETRLQAIERAEDLEILFAVESGSRAWGFPSPDSDYDVRFVYRRNLDSYLAIDSRRDVVELPIDLPFDINGWDLTKALQLLLKANPVLLEWLQSPIRYRWNDETCEKLLALAAKSQHLLPARYHYLRLGQRQWSCFVEDKEEVQLKKYFYVLRPALALRWLRLSPDRLPPMNLAELRSGTELPEDTSLLLDDLIARKAETREMGQGKRMDVLDRLIEEEFAKAENAQDLPRAPDLTEEANALFREVVLDQP
jgi:predicted nucleotidyltransferase